MLTTWEQTEAPKVWAANHSRSVAPTPSWA